MPTPAATPATRVPAGASAGRVATTRVVDRVTDRAGTLLAAYATTVLRVAMGLVFLGFGVLKYVPGFSPAQDLAETTTRILTFGLVPDRVALVGVATLECVIGLCLLLGGRLLRPGLVLLVPELAGILSPVVLLPHRLFAGPHHAPTLEAQYVLKDVILVGAAMVLATTLTRRGTTTPAGSPLRSTDADAAPRVVPTREKLAIVLAGLREQCPLGELCDRHGITETDYHRWTAETLTAAAAITAAQTAREAAAATEAIVPA